MPQAISKNSSSGNAAGPAARPRAAGVAERAAAGRRSLEEIFAETLSSILGGAVPAHLAVAVSGGSDSMALALLAADWCRTRGLTLTALTVDHGLRGGSSAEARQTGDWLRDCGIPHEVLTWRGAKPISGIQARARRARYDLLLDWCRHNGAETLLLGHQLEDQAETFLMRLERGSGPAGLAAMAPVRRQRGIRLVRPLLAQSRDRLREYLAAVGQDWIDDPSNDDPAFERTRTSNLVHALGLRSVGAERLAGLAGDFARLDALVQSQVTSFLEHHGAIIPAGFAELDPRAFARLPEGLAEAVLRRLLQTIGGNRYPAGRAKLGLLCRRLRRAEPFEGETLAGCHLFSGNHKLMITREIRAPDVRRGLGSGGRIFWSGVFEIEFRHFDKPLYSNVYLAPLGPAGWAEVKASGGFAEGAEWPFPAKIALPALFDGEGVFEVPHLKYKRPDRAGAPGLIAAVHFLPLNQR